LPPASETPDYDPNELNRKMEPTIAQVGVFRFDGYLRMSEQTTLEKFLAAQKGDFLSFYDTTMKCETIPAIKGLQTPFVLIKQSAVMFTPSA
jgi:hypothetical protein